MVCCSLWGHKESDTTERLKWTEPCTSNFWEKSPLLSWNTRDCIWGLTVYPSSPSLGPGKEQHMANTWRIPECPKVLAVILWMSFIRGMAKCNSLSHIRLFVTPWLPCPSPTPGACSDSCPSSQWCHPIISSSVVPFSSCLQSFLTSESSPVSQFFASGGQSIRAWASASVLPMNVQGWFPLGLAGLISLQSKGLSRVFSSTTVQKHQCFSIQLSLWANSYICTWLMEKP